MTLSIRRAQKSDQELVFALVCELADYEQLQHEVAATPEDIGTALFAPQPRVFCDIAEWDGEPAGFAVWFLNFSTFRGRHGVYLEDLYVRPACRGHGIGTGLMRAIARHCLDNDYARVEWAVLDWNTPSIGFYEKVGAKLMTEWKLCRLTGPALARFAQGETA